jgi:hypothetical protein
MLHVVDYICIFNFLSFICIHSFAYLYTYSPFVVMSPPDHKVSAKLGNFCLVSYIKKTQISSIIFVNFFEGLYAIKL